MRKDFGANAWMYPMPVLILASYDEAGTPDAMNAAWGGISGGHQLTACISAGHQTTRNILARKAFTVSMADVDHLVACDYLGMVSGKDVPDKLARAGLHVSPAPNVDAPLIDELPMTLECRLMSYDEATGQLIGDIVNICADERVLDGQGRIDPDKLQPITFDPVHNVYRQLGKAVGHAFLDGAALK